MEVYPVRSWDSKSNTGELMELFHQLRKSYEMDYNQVSGVTEEQFVEKQGLLIWGVQKEKVTFTLFNNGRLDARFCQDDLDKVGGDE